MNTKMAVGAIASCALFYTGTSWAQCTTAPLEPASTRPALTGRLAFHSQPIGGDRNSGVIYVYDFGGNQITRVNSYFSADITSGANPVFSPDGRWIVFPALRSAANRRDLVLAKVEAKADGAVLTPLPTYNITSSHNPGPSEDARFSADGTMLAYKEHGDVRIDNINLTTTPPTVALNRWVTSAGGSPEYSMPSFSASGQWLYFTSGTGANLDIWRKNLQASAPVEAVNTTVNLEEYYPVVRDMSTLLYTRWTSLNDHHDQIYMRSIANPGEVGYFDTLLKINACLYENTDPTPVNENLVIFSSSRDNYLGQYTGGNRLYLGNIWTGQVWSLDHLAPIAGVTGNLLGASYSALRAMVGQ